MIFARSFIGAAVLFSGLVSGLPRPMPDSAIGGEAAVSAPNGIPITDTAELSSQLSSATSTAYGASSTDASGSYNYGSNNGYGQSNPYAQSSEASATTSAYGSYSTPTYGSGSSNWNSGSNYDDCVSQCLATYGSSPSPYTPPTSTEKAAGSSGTNGVTHTVIVAPTQGVLRYIPFAVNASVGDTVKFMWGANNHTVTKSSALTPCNKSADAFASGLQIKDFVFEQVVNDTNPTYFYCAAPNHCQKGMFGMINPPSSAGQPTSFSAMIQDMGAKNPDMAAYTTYTAEQTANNDAAAKWGGNINVAALPEWAQPLAAANVLYTRNFLAKNAETLKDDGSVDLSSATSTPLMIPQDVGAALNNAAAAPASPAASSAAATSAAPSATATAESLNNGAGSLASPRALVGLAVVLATFFAL